MDPNIPTSWPETIKWIVGAMGALTIVYLIFATLNQGKKLFGRKPPMDEQVELLDRDLRKDMAAGDAAVLDQVKCLRLDMNAQFSEMGDARRDHASAIERSFEKLARKLDEQTVELKASAERRTEATNDKITELKVSIGKIEERTKNL